MKTINHLLVIALLIFSSSCSYEDLFNSDDDSSEEPLAFLELDLHQLVLKAQEIKLHRELEEIWKAREVDEGNEDLIKKEKQLKNDLEFNSFVFKNNEELLRGIRGIRGPRPPRTPCGHEDPNNFNCSRILMPKNQKIWFHKEQGELINVEITLLNGGEVFSEMAGIEIVKFDGGVYQEVVMAGNQSRDGLMTITKRSSNGDLTTYSLPIER